MTIRRSIPIIAALLLALGGCAGAGDKTGAYVDDSVITSKVKSAFVEDKQVSALNISVTTNQGVVELTGKAKSAEESSKAASLARNVSGVRAVRNHITVGGS